MVAIALNLEKAEKMKVEIERFIDSENVKCLGRIKFFFLEKVNLVKVDLNHQVISFSKTTNSRKKVSFSGIYIFFFFSLRYTLRTKLLCLLCNSNQLCENPKKITFLKSCLQIFSEKLDFSPPIM